jgi:copper chaperone CopZ
MLGLLAALVGCGGCNKGNAPTPSGAADASKYPVTAEKTGIFICCAECEKQVRETLSKVGGVDDVKCDLKNKVVTYKARDGKAATAGDRALEKAGFGGKYKEDPPRDLGFYYAVGDAISSGSPVEAVTFKGVHVCCEGCEKAIRELFKDAEVTFEGTGPQKDIKLKGKNLDLAHALNALKKAGFKAQD